MPAMSAREYLQKVVIPAQRRGARVVGSEAMPEVAEGVQREARKQEQLARQRGTPLQVQTDQRRGCGSLTN